MPHYEFLCTKCNEEYDDFVPYDETDKYKTVKCPHCGSGRKEKLVSTCAFQFSNPVDTDRYNNSHDYRYKHKQPKIKAERENAMKKSHMGDKPYRDIDDTRLDKNFDFGKI